jgi:hypothetical protein
MKQRNSPPFWVIFGVGAVVLASFGFVLASLGGSRGEPAASSLPAARMPAATPMPTKRPTPTPAVSPALQPSSPLPTTATKTAPDFTLGRADGSTFTLSEQLAQGPVVLVFFQRCTG